MNSPLLGKEEPGVGGTDGGKAVSKYTAKTFQTHHNQYLTSPVRDVFYFLSFKCDRTMSSPYRRHGAAQAIRMFD